MQKILRAIVLVGILTVVGIVVYSQTDWGASANNPLSAAQNRLAKNQQAVAPIAATAKSVAPSFSTPYFPASSSGVASAIPVTPLMGSEASPVAVKVLASALSPDDVAEREKDRQIQRGIERYMARLAMNSRVEEYLLLFVSFIYFATLLLLGVLLVNVRKSAESSVKAAEAAKKCAELAEAAFRQAGQSAARKLPPHFYHKR